MRPASDPASASASLHARILSDLRDRILSGAWAPGTRVPFEHELAVQYGCARMTVNKAVAELARAGLVERRRKAGTFVARPRSQSAVLDIHDIGREVGDLGLDYTFTLLHRRVRPAAPEDAAAFEVALAAPVLDLACRHMAGLQPFCSERRLISLGAVPDAGGVDFSTVPPGSWLTAEVPWTEAEHRIRAAAADREAAGILGVPAGSPCLVVERRTWSAGQPITQVSLTYPGAAHHVVARFTPPGS